MQKDIDLNPQEVKMIGLILTFDVYVIYDKEISLEAIKYLKAFRILKCDYREKGEIAQKAIIGLYLENEKYTNFFSN